MERKTLKFEIKSVDEETGIIEGYGATFSDKPDSYNDIIDPGAFTKTLKEQKDSIVSLFNHNIMEPIGLPELSQDKNGLWAKIHLVMEVQKARDVLALARAGVIKRMSIGYDTVKSDFIGGVRHLKEIRLYDVSPVVFAANPEATIMSVKDVSTLSNEDLTSLERSALEEMKKRVEAEEERMELKPYPHEHSCRLRDPGDFQPNSFRRITRQHDSKEYDIILGKLKGEDSMTPQAFRYNKDTWDESDARSHCTEHDGIKFEPATQKQDTPSEEKEEKAGRVLSSASMGKVRSALEALQALLEAAEGEQEPEKSTPYPEGESYEAAELDAVIAELKADNEGFDTKEAIARIDDILGRIRKEDKD